MDTLREDNKPLRPHDERRRTENANHVQTLQKDGQDTQDRKTDVPTDIQGLPQQHENNHDKMGDKPDNARRRIGR